LHKQIAFSAPDQPLYREANWKGGQLKYVNGIPLLITQGTPEQIGTQEFTLSIDATRPLLRLPRKMLGEDGAKPNFAKMVWPAIVNLSRATMDRAPARYRKEWETGARSAKLTREEQETFLVANSMVELRRYACSAFLVEPPRSSSGEMLFGRNMDMPTYGVIHRYSLVTICRPKGYHAFVSVGFPGLIGVVSGMNDAGLALACLDSGPAKDGSPAFLPQGAPLALMFRRILEECATVAEAQKLLQSGKHNTWMNLAVCDQQRAAVFEITAYQVAVREAESHLLAATNHFRTPALSMGKDCDRYERLSKYWQRVGPLALRDVARAMSEVANNTTIQTMVFEAARLRLHVSLGTPPATARPLVALELAKLLKP